VDVLSRNSWVEHVLFLADRTELVDQAKKAFAKLMPSMSISVLSDKRDDGNPDTARIVFSTYQTMIHAIDSEKKRFGVGRFDLIIIDEAHRSIFNKYGTIFEYFDSLLVGLTATPRDEVDANTYKVFECDIGVPNFEYTMQQGRNDHFLVGWKLKNYTTEVMREGIKYDELSAAEKEDYEEGFEDAGYDATPEEVGNEKIFRAVYNTPTCDRVLETLMREGQKVESGEFEKAESSLKTMMKQKDAQEDHILQRQIEELRSGTSEHFSTFFVEKSEMQSFWRWFSKRLDSYLAVLEAEQTEEVSKMTSEISKRLKKVFPFIQPPISVSAYKNESYAIFISDSYTKSLSEGLDALFLEMPENVKEKIHWIKIH
jgi:superfamily II DNA or RNA helicase